MDLDLWKRIKTEQDLSYDVIAEKSGIPKTTVTNIFCGYVKTPRIDTVQAIERALGIADDGIWTAEDYANGVVDTKKASITADEEDMLDLFREIGKRYGEQGQQLLMEMATLVFLQKK